MSMDNLRDEQQRGERRLDRNRRRTDSFERLRRAFVEDHLTYALKLVQDKAETKGVSVAWELKFSSYDPQQDHVEITAPGTSRRSLLGWATSIHVSARNEDRANPPVEFHRHNSEGRHEMLYLATPADDNIESLPIYVGGRPYPFSPCRLLWRGAADDERVAGAILADLAGEQYAGDTSDEYEQIVLGMGVFEYSIKKPSRCFIATAAFGADVHVEVVRLGSFRDQILLQHAAGKIVVRWYERYSPGAADFIRERPWLRRCVRVGLRAVAVLLARTARERSR